MSRWTRPLTPTLGTVLVVAAPALTFIVTALDRGYQVDFWHHLARGRAIVEQGRVVNEDLFTFTVAGQPLQDPNWLTQVGFFLLYRAGGLELVQLVHALMLTVALGLFVGICYRASRSLVIAGALGLFCFLGLWQIIIAVRPQTVTLLLFVLLYDLLDRSERRPWLLWLAPLLLGIWANVHGAFPLGFLLIGGFLAGAVWDAGRDGGWQVWRDVRVRWLGLCLAAGVLATFVNPYGPWLYEYVRLISVQTANRDIMEWKPPGTVLFIGKVWVASVLLVLAAALLSARRPRARDLVLMALFLALSAGAVRMVGWWLLVSLPAVAYQLGAAWPLARYEQSFTGRVSLASRALFVLFLLLEVASVPGVTERLLRLRGIPRPYDTLADLDAAVDYLEKDRGTRPSNVFSLYEWGEYLEWKLAEHGGKVYMDGRIEIYPDSVYDDYVALLRGRADWQEILDRYNVDTLILSEGYVPLTKGLRPLVEKSATWGEPAFRSGDVLVFVRRTKK